MCEKRVRSACIQNVTACSSIFEQEDIKIEPVVATVEVTDQSIRPADGISSEQMGIIKDTLKRLKADTSLFLKDFLVTGIEELEATTFNLAMADIKSGKYSPKPKSKGF
jgi:hypothetical protein